MWNYHTIAYAVKEGARYASVHGSNCAAPNTCQVTVARSHKNCGQRDRAAYHSAQADVYVAERVYFLLANACLANNSVWPSNPGNAVGSIIQITPPIRLHRRFPCSGPALARSQLRHRHVPRLFARNRPVLKGRRLGHHRLVMRPVSVARLHDEPWLCHRQLDLAKFSDVERASTRSPAYDCAVPLPGSCRHRR